MKNARIYAQLAGLLLVACGGDGEANAFDGGVLGAKVLTELDGRVLPLYNGICTDLTLCFNGASTDVGTVCTAHTTGAASLGSAPACLVSPAGTWYLASWDLDQVITSPGWSINSSLNRPGTLSASDEARCAQELAAAYQADAGSLCASL